MSSYKKHVLFSIVVALPFIPNIFYLSLAVIGASIIDMDHHVKKNNLIFMAFSGFLLTVTLYILKLPFLIGVSLIVMAIIFYISKHRGFTHSIWGIVLLSSLLSFFVLGLNSLFNGFTIETPLSLILISLILGITVLNKKILLPFIIIVLLGIILLPYSNINIPYTFLAILLGGISHVMLDLFTPSGIRLLNPLSSRKFKKSEGVVLFILWTLGACIFNFKILSPLINFINSNL